MNGDSSALPHLPLRRAMASGDRRRVRRGFSRTRQHGDFARHASDIEKRVTTLSVTHLQRRAVAGVDPKLILAFELSANVDAEDFRRAELRVLDESRGTFVIAFADDPQLREFKSRLERYGEGIPEDEGRKGAAYEAFFDSITEVRVLEPDDRIADRLRESLAEMDPDVELRLDIELWHPGDGELGRSGWRTRE